MTGQRDLDVALDSVESGACSFMQKPFDNLDVVAKTVTEAIERGSKLTQLNKDTMQLLIEAIPQVLILLDDDNKVRYINRAGRRVLEREFTNIEQLTYKDLVNILEIDPLDKSHQFTDELQLSQSSYELTVHSLGGATGRGVGNLILLRDLSAQKESERLQSEFLSLITHEFRTPLSVIKSGLTLLAKDSIQSEVKKELIHRNKQQIKRLMQMVNNIIDISKIESGLLLLNTEPIDIEPFFTDIVKFFESGRIKGEAGLKLQLGDDIPDMILADPNRLQQILINLIGNALKFAPENSNIIVRVGKGKRELIVEVEDKGGGIPKDRLREIFKKFVQADSTLQRTHGGSGLGLTISKSLVDAHGGRIEVESEEGNGALFRFTIPFSTA